MRPPGPLLALACAAALAAAEPALADLDVAVRFGHGGRWVEDAITPVAVDLTNTGAEPVGVALTLARQGLLEGADLEHRREVYVGAGASRREVFLALGPQAQFDSARVRVETSPRVPIHSGSDTATKGRMDVDVSPGDYLSQGVVPFAARAVGVLFDERSVLAARLSGRVVPEAGSDEPAPASDAQALAVDPDLLRFAPFVLDGLDALVVRDPDAAFCSDPATLDALLDWVALGGRLVVSLGEHAPQFAASPLAAEMPATWAGVGRADYAQVLVQVSESALRRRPPPAEGPWAALAPNALAHRTIPSPALGSPLRVERRLGMGAIVLLPFDATALATVARTDDKGLGAIATLLAGRTPPPAGDPGGVSLPAWQAATADREVRQRLIEALREGAFHAPPFPLVFALLALYVVVVGPLDWFVLKRLRKERLTTFTFAGAVTAFTLLAYGTSMFLFAAGSRVNRIVFADLATHDATGAREGRELIRLHELAGWYSPRGADYAAEYPAPAVLLPPRAPGLLEGGEVGRTLPILVEGADPVRPRGTVQVAFRSQRLTRTVVAGPTGRTVEVEWVPGEDGKAGVRVTNGLAHDLAHVWVVVSVNLRYDVGPLSAGQTSPVVQARMEYVTLPEIAEDRTGTALRNLTLFGVALQFGASAERRSPLLAKAGIDRSGALDRGRALLVALASESPLALPGEDIGGSVHVVIRKEVPRP